MKRLIAMLLLLSGMAFSQTTINATNINTKNVTAAAGGGAGIDFRNANHTLPYKVGTVAQLPANCTVGERYFATNPTNVGQQTYSCTNTNVWTLDFSGTVVLATLNVTTLNVTSFVSSAFTSSVANPASSGFIRAAKTDCFKFRNNANSGDINGLCLNGSDQVTIGSGPFIIPSVADTAVGKTTSDALQNKSMNGAGNGNSVTLIDGQGPASAIVGTAADVNLFTKTVTANTWAANKCITIDVGWVHSTGTAATTYKLKFGGTTISTIGPIADTNAGSIASYKVCNIAQNSQYYELTVALGAATNTINQQFGTSAIDFSASQAISFTFNVAATDQVTPKFWRIVLDQ